ncbi:MAG TPA: PIN domain-containing protein [Pirellulaceae bacterium]|jgi:uncharacterized protein YacL|nr:PIN domain-containing protein [Pirellulaceae bacterium]
MLIWILRGVFLLVSAGLGVTLARSNSLPSMGPLMTFIGVVGLSIVIVIGDVLIRRKRIDLISGIYFGTLMGICMTTLITLAVSPWFSETEWELIRGPITLILGTSLVYICISILLQTKDDFRFLIPYVEFQKDLKGAKPYILDTSVVIDGRIADIVETGIVDNQLIMPRFILNELQSVADSNDRLRRARGRRGLDVLNRLRGNKQVELKIYEREHPEMEGQPVDMKLVMLAKALDGKVVTGDYNLNKVARLQNVAVVNLNDVANSLKPVFLPGEEFEVRIIKPGEEISQGVGYLDDGTMIVVEGARDRIGENIRLTVTSVLQTSAGRMIFGRFVGLVTSQRH